MGDEDFAAQLLASVKDFQAKLLAQSEIAIECYRLQLDESSKKQEESAAIIKQLLNGGQAMSGQPASPG